MPTKLEYTPGMTKKRYQVLASDRKRFEDIAERCAALTMPYLHLPDGTSPGSDIEMPVNSLAGDGVNSLANKIMMSLFPPNASFFRFMVRNELLREYMEATDPTQRTEDDALLADYERIVMHDIRTSGDRASKHNAIELMLVTGNALVYQPKDASLKVYQLRRFVVKRDPLGHVIEIITSEDIDPRTAAPEIQQLYYADKDENAQEADPKSETLYTHVRFHREGSKGRWIVHQEFMGNKVQGTDGSYPEHECPFIPLRPNQLDSWDYGLPYVYRFLGDLEQLETLSAWLRAYFGIVMKVLFLVQPGSVIREKHLAEAKSGDFIRGEHTAVDTLQVNKFNDMAQVQQQIEILSQRINKNFLVFEARASERTTALEVSTDLRELQDDLGVFITLLNEEFQQKYVAIKIHRLKKSGNIPAAIDKFAEVAIITGIDALGRGHDLGRMLEAFNALQLVNNIPPDVKQFMNIPELISRVFNGSGVDEKGLIRSAEELAQEQAAAQQQQQQQQLLQAATPEAMKQLGNVVNQSVTNELEGEAFPDV